MGFSLVLTQDSEQIIKGNGFKTDKLGFNMQRNSAILLYPAYKSMFQIKKPPFHFL